jgi:hypothetical protein
MDDHVFDIGFINARLTGAPSSLSRRIVVWKNTNNVEIVRVNEIGSLRVRDGTSENQM